MRLPLLGGGPFLVVNGDVWTDYPFGRLRSIKCDWAHLVMVPNPPQHPAGDFSLARGVIGNAPSPRYTYAGIAVLSPLLVAAIATGQKAPLAPLWRAAAARGEVTGELYEGYWSDVGTPERLGALQARLKKT